jgi:GDP-L-fucose synthase
MESQLSGVLNLGSGIETELAHLAEAVGSAVGFQGEIRWDTSKPNGQPRRCLDGRRAFEHLGFKPAIGLEQGLQETVAWFRNFAKHRMAA